MNRYDATRIQSNTWVFVVLDSVLTLEQLGLQWIIVMWLVTCFTVHSEYYDTSFSTT